MTDKQKPLCLAPFTSFVVDTNKGVRPCCEWEGGYLGKLNDQSFDQIETNPEWQKVKTQLMNQEWPKGCSGCQKREQTTGWSVRQLFQDDGRGYKVSGWDSGQITYIEFAGSNLCNLACLHCNPGYSSKWIKDHGQLMELYPTFPDPGPEHEDQYRVYKNNPPNPNLVLQNLKLMDLRGVQTINLKGGEPMLNEESLVVMRYLDELGVLSQAEVAMNTNGTVWNEEFNALIAKARKVNLYISIDGYQDLNPYVRYGNSHTDLIEKNVLRWAEMTNTNIYRTTSVMPYNLYHLLPLRDWWYRLSAKATRVYKVCNFSLFVMYPPWLSLNVLSDEYRKKVADLLKAEQQYEEFDSVIKVLEGPYAGDEMHNIFVNFTMNMQKIRKNDILKIVPELEPELKLL